MAFDEDILSRNRKEARTVPITTQEKHKNHDHKTATVVGRAGILSRLWNLPMHRSKTTQDFLYEMMFDMWSAQFLTKSSLLPLSPNLVTIPPPTKSMRFKESAS